MEQDASADYWQRVRSHNNFGRRRWVTADELHASLADLNIASHDDLIKLLPELDKPAQIAAIRVLDVLQVRSAGKALFRCWLASDRNISFAAGQALQSIGSHKAFRLLIEYIWSQPTPAEAEQACYLLSHSGDNSLLDPLVAIYNGEDMPFEVRAQAAEGIAYQLSHVDRRTKRYRRALPHLLKGLRDPVPEVRFWTCFALGHMRAKQALPELERMAEEDDARCPTWWLIKDEAADAICHILGVEAPERGPRLGP